MYWLSLKWFHFTKFLLRISTKRKFFFITKFGPKSWPIIHRYIPIITSNITTGIISNGGPCASLLTWPGISHGLYITLLLKVWSTDQQHEHHPVSQKCRLASPIQTQGIQDCILTRCQEILMHYRVCKALAPEKKKPNLYVSVFEGEVASQAEPTQDSSFLLEKLKFYGQPMFLT